MPHPLCAPDNLYIKRCIQLAMVFAVTTRRRQSRVYLSRLYTARSRLLPTRDHRAGNRGGMNDYRSSPPPRDFHVTDLRLVRFL